MEKTKENQAAVKNGVSRLIFVVLSILVEVGVILLLVFYAGQKAAWIYSALHFLGTILVLRIYGSHKTAAIRMTWMLVILLLPIFGTLLYVLIGLNGHSLKMRKRYEDIDKILLPMLPANDEVAEKARARDLRLGGIIEYIRRQAGYPVYENTEIRYFDDAEKGFEAQKRDLAKAEKFIFMEYHAIEDAECWHEMLEVLVDRVKAGVEVRVFYDDMGSLGFINTDFVKRCEAVGIQCRVFNPFAPGLNLFLNNRDHRKITVIDGKVGFTGGYNLANEYFHRTEPYGYWKDTGVRLEGDAVQSLTVTFLEMWNAISEYDKDDIDFLKYVAAANAEHAIAASRKKASEEQAERIARDKEAGFDKVKETILQDEKYLADTGTAQGSSLGFVQPYADSPMDDIHIGEDVYISMAESAQKYAWFITPYLIITDEMCHAIVYSVTRSYYNGLARSGVRIFEYTPGFCHAKMSVVDDLMATCGTINLDYRSLYHHFENGCLYADCDAVMDTRKDFEAMFAQSREVTEYYATGRGALMRFWQMLLRLAAPLM